MDRVEDEVDESVRTGQPHRGHIALPHVEVGAAGLGAQLLHHGGGLLDAVNTQSTFGQGQRDPSRPDREFEDGTVTGKPGKEVDRLGLVAAQFIVIVFGDVGAEAGERVEVLHR